MSTVCPRTEEANGLEPFSCNMQRPGQNQHKSCREGCRGEPEDETAFGPNSGDVLSTVSNSVEAGVGGLPFQSGLNLETVKRSDRARLILKEIINGP